MQVRLRYLVREEPLGFATGRLGSGWRVRYLDGAASADAPPAQPDELRTGDGVKGEELKVKIRTI